MKKKILKFISILSFLVIIPISVFAVNLIVVCPAGSSYDGIACVPNSAIESFILQIQDILDSVIPVLIALGVVYFVWGVVRYVIGDEEETKKKGKNQMIYGIIGLAVIVSLWGLVLVLVDTFGLDSAAPVLDTLTIAGPSCTLIGNPNPLFQDLLCYITGIINDFVIPLIFALAIVMFVWGTIDFLIINADDEKKRAQGKQFMIWGIVALAVMLSIWGLVGILGDTFDFDTSILPHVTPS